MNVSFLPAQRRRQTLLFSLCVLGGLFALQSGPVAAQTKASKSHKASVAKRRPPAKTRHPKKAVTKKPVVKKPVVKKLVVGKPVFTPVKPAALPKVPTPTPPPPLVRPNPPVLVTPPGAAAAQMGTAYPISGCELTLEKAEYKTDALPSLFGANLPDPGTRYLLFTIKVHNAGNAPVQWSFAQFNPVLYTVGTTISAPLRAINLLTASNNKFEKQPVQPGEDKTLRFHFQVPQAARPTRLTIGGSEGTPQYAFDLAGVQ